MNCKWMKHFSENYAETQAERVSACGKHAKMPLRFLILFDVLLLTVFAIMVVQALYEQRGNDIKKEQYERALNAGGEDSLSVMEDRKTQMLGEALNYTTVNARCVCGSDGNVDVGFCIDIMSQFKAKLEIIDLDADEKITEAVFLDPGYCLDSIMLNKSLPEGIYHCIARLEFYWVQNGFCIGTAARQLELTVM